MRDEVLHRCRPGCPCGGWDGADTGDEPLLDPDELPDRVAQRVAETLRRKAETKRVRAELDRRRVYGLDARHRRKHARLLDSGGGDVA